MPHIRIVNNSKIVTNAQVRAAARAIQVQVRRDFAPDWGHSATVSTRRKTAADWVVSVQDTIDTSGALGYHDVTGLTPTAIVDVALCKHYGLNWTVTLSHEVLEMLGDPTCNLVRPYPGGRSVAYEACDPVEADRCGYLINGVQVSDFVLQAWFTGAPGPYDFTRKLTAPLSLAPGGYVAVLDASGWHQVFAYSSPGVVSRRELSTRVPARGVRSNDD